MLYCQIFYTVNEMFFDIEVKIGFVWCIFATNYEFKQKIIFSWKWRSINISVHSLQLYQVLLKYILLVFLVDLITLFIHLFFSYSLLIILIINDRLNKLIDIPSIHYVHTVLFYISFWLKLNKSTMKVNYHINNAYN